MSDSLYFFLIELVTVCKIYCFKKNIDNIRKSIEKVESENYISKDENEDEYGKFILLAIEFSIWFFVFRFVSWAMTQTILFYIVGNLGCHICLSQWALGPFIPNSGKYTICPAWFPFEYRFGPGFYFVYFYQMFGNSYCAWTFMAIDTITMGLFFHATAQIKILGHNIQKVY